MGQRYPKGFHQAWANLIHHAGIRYLNNRISEADYDGILVLFNSLADG